MTAKRFVRKTFRKARRKVCCYIVGFDRCPTGCRKNYKQIVANGLAGLALTVVGVIGLAVLMILA